MSVEPIEFAAVKAEHRGERYPDGPLGYCAECGAASPCPTYLALDEAERLAGKVARVEAKADEWSKSPGAAANAAARVLRVALADQPEQVQP